MLSPRAESILSAEYPKFSEPEMERRRQSVFSAMSAAGVDHIVIYGSGWRGSVVHWLTHWPVTTEAACVITPGERDVMFVHYYNHLPLARRFAHNADVRWAGPSTFGNVADELAHRGATSGRVGIIGQLGYEAHALLSERFGKLVSLSKTYVELRKVKSAEEIEWFEIGAAFSDLGVKALAEASRPGTSERELANAVERSYVGLGGATGLHFISTTPMADPSVSAPCQYPSARRIARGDVVSCEISADLYGYSGQVLRTFFVGEEPNALFRELHAVAEAAFEAIAGVLRPGALPEEVVAASRLIEEAGFTTIDDILHGYGGGYFPPVLGSTSRSNGKLPQEPFVEGQLVVVQPNVTTRDHKAGVQTGEMVLITKTGIRRMHQFPRGYQVV